MLKIEPCIHVPDQKSDIRDLKSMACANFQDYISFQKAFEPKLGFWILDFYAIFWFGFEVAKYELLLRVVSLSKWL